MGRPLRPNPAGWFHVTNRGSRRWNIYLEDRDRRLFLHLLASMKRRTDVRIIAYCLMGNHFHLILHCPEPSLSTAMHHLASHYARLFNRNHSFDGTLCKDRFHSEEITDSDYLLSAVRYVHRNPLDLDPDAELATHRWSSHQSYVRWAPTPWWLDTRPVLDLFGGDRDRYRCMVEGNDPPPLPARPQPDLWTMNELLGGDVTAAMVERAIALAEGLEVEAVHKLPGRFGQRLRSASLLVASDMGSLAPAQLADCYGYQNEKSARRSLLRARDRREVDPELADLVERASSIIDRRAA